MNRAPAHRRRDLAAQQKGFTLIEIAIVLFIITLVMIGITQFVNAQLVAARITATSTKQDAIKTALINFAARNNRLPCPAILTTPGGTPGEGFEAPTVGNTTCTGTMGSDANGTVFAILDPPTTVPIVSTGEVPWQSLGLSHEASLDGYANRFTYQVTWAATQPNQTISGIAGMRGVITLHSAGPGVYGASTPGNPLRNQINDCRPGDITQPYTPVPNFTNPCAAVAVIVSHGVDGYGAFNDGGIQVQFPPQITGMDEKENTNGDSKFVVKPYSSIDTNPYDDIVLSLTARDILAPLTNSGAMQDARAALNLNFSIIKSMIVGSAANGFTGTTVIIQPPAASCSPMTPQCPVYTQYSYTLPPGTFGSISWSPPESSASVSFTPPFSCATSPCIQNRTAISNVFTALSTSPARLDPWNKEIQYVLFNSSPTLTFTNPATGALDAASNTAYRLLSWGPDATPNTGDDIWVDVSFGELLQQLPSR